MNDESAEVRRRADDLARAAVLLLEIMESESRLKPDTAPVRVMVAEENLRVKVARYLRTL